RLLSSPAGTEAHRAAPSEQAAVQEKPETVPAAPVAKEVAAPSDDHTADAPTPVPAPAATPAASVPAADNSVEKPLPGDVVEQFAPEVPLQILGTIRGKVTVSVKVTVDRSGAVVDAELDSRAGSKYFDKVAVDAARRWRFKPASGAGNAVESARLLRFEFRTDGCEASSGPAR